MEKLQWDKVRVLVANYCNYKCPFCHNEGQDKATTKERMSLQSFKRLVVAGVNRKDKKMWGDFYADNGYYMAFGVSFPGGCDSHTESGRNRIGSVSARESIIFAFFRRRERADSSEFPVCGKCFTASCKNFVAVCLMSHVPYNTVVWCIVDVVQSYG